MQVFSLFLRESKASSLLSLKPHCDSDVQATYWVFDLCVQLMKRSRTGSCCFEGTGSFFPAAGTAAHESSQSKVKRFSSFLKPLSVQVRAVTTARGHKMASSYVSLFGVLHLCPDVPTDRWRKWEASLLSIGAGFAVCSGYVVCCVLFLNLFVN